VSEQLAILGGPPTRRTMLPYGRQWVDDDDVAAVVATLRSDWLTTGPGVAEFETEFLAAVGANYAVAVSNGTAALHAAMFALGIGPGDEVIVPTLTFAASANCVVYQGGTPVFADVDPQSLLLDPESVTRHITPRTRAIVAVDYAGQPCDYAALRDIAARAGIPIVSDAAHALGARWRDLPVGSIADLTTFSLHPVKQITSGEGGMIATNDAALAARMRQFRNHGITTDHRQREANGAWSYEMTDLGYNYRLTDFQCALGRSQLRKLGPWVERRREIARRYDEAFGQDGAFEPLTTRSDVFHSYHLYVVQVIPERLGNVNRDTVFAALRAEGIGVNVHYLPVHLHPFYRRRFGTHEGMCPNAEAAGACILSLPLFPRMTDSDVSDVIRAVRKVESAYAATAVSSR
jgi:perosamine synthetase